MRGYFSIWVLVVLYLAGFTVRAQNSVPESSAPMVVAALSDEEKRKLFLKAREDIRMKASPTPTPRKSKPRPAARESATPTPRPKSTATPEPTPADTPKKPTRVPARQQPTPRSTPVPPVEKKPADNTPPAVNPQIPVAPVVIEKSGLSQAEGYEPPPAASGGFLGLNFGGPRYRYLTPAVRKQIDRAHVRKGRWKYIVIHNSGTRQGNARAFDLYHRKVRKMQNGMAYHFVIGDGHGSGDGEIEIGNRWRQQINGGHVASDYLNNIAIGICLVGDFNRDRPTKAQLAAIEELTTYLRKRVGRFDGKSSTVMAHREINTRPTDCPGNKFPYSWLHGKFR